MTTLFNAFLLFVGVSTQVAQSRIQECLDSLSETEYSYIMKQYKVSVCVCVCVCVCVSRSMRVWVQVGFG